nr:molecular chaperone TorD family protein [uncultured Bacillus sp.]
MNAQMPMSVVSELLLAREYAYDILRRIFIEEPSREYLAFFIGQKMYAEFPFLNDSEGMQKGAADIQVYCREFDPVNNEMDFENLHWDYTRMFVGPFELASPPWESVYVRNDRQLFQQTTMDVRKVFQKYGFAASSNYREAEDHIGLELDFMFHLNQLCLQLADKEDPESIRELRELLAEQQQFLHRHLLIFVPEFAGNVVEHSETLFYRGSAKLLEHFLQMDSEVLKELLNIEIIHQS